MVPAPCRNENGGIWLRRLEDIDPDLVTAIVLDTNAFSRGRFSKPRLEAWAREASNRGLEVLIPDVVGWELAAHVAELYEETRLRVDASMRSLTAAGLTVTPIPPLSVEDVWLRVEEQIANLEPNVRLVESTAENAFEGLMDQVLGRPAEQKKGIKTGAADATWLRSVLEQSDDPDDGIVIVSADALIVDRLATLDLGNPVVVPEWNELREGLFRYRSAGPAAVQGLMIFLVDTVHSGRWREALDIGPVSAADIVRGFDWGLWDGATPRQLDVELSELSSAAGIDDATIGADDNTLVAEAVLIGEVAVTGWFDDPEGTSLTPVVEIILDATIRARLVFALDRGQVQWANADEDSRAFMPAVRFGDDDEALDEVLPTLAYVPLLDTLSVDWSAQRSRLQSDKEATWDLGEGLTLELHLEGSAGDGWRLSAGIQGRWLELVCEYDASTWVGGGDGMHFDPPWTLRVDSGLDRATANPFWALAEFVNQQVARPSAREGDTGGPQEPSRGEQERT
jgi:hypothetical protein